MSYSARVEGLVNIYIYIFIMFMDIIYIKLAFVVEGDPKAPFSIATTLYKKYVLFRVYTFICIFMFVCVSLYLYRYAHTKLGIF